MKHLYLAEVTTVAGRNGHSKSSDGLLDIDVRMPKEFGGSSEATNPEQLFAAAWGACFGSSIALVAGQQKVKIGEIKVTAKIGVILKGEVHGLTSELAINISGVEKDVANELVNKAKSVCAYSTSTKGNIETSYIVI